jgi:hypothetical protein
MTIIDFPHPITTLVEFWTVREYRNAKKELHRLPHLNAASHPEIQSRCLPSTGWHPERNIKSNWQHVATCGNHNHLSEFVHICRECETQILSSHLTQIQNIQ